MVAHISHQQVAEILEKHSHVYLFYDWDAAGWRGAQQAARLLTKGGAKVDIIRPDPDVENLREMDYASFMRQFRRRTPYPCAIGETHPSDKARVPSYRVSVKEN